VAQQVAAELLGKPFRRDRLTRLEDDAGERPLACIVWKKGAEIAPAEIADSLGRHLLGHSFAKWQLPDRYEVIDGVPRTSTGKFWKLKLRERFPR